MSEDNPFPWKVKNIVSAVSEFTQSKPDSPSKDVADKAPIEKIDEPELVSETKSAGVVEFFKEMIGKKPEPQENEWEMLSGKISNCSAGGVVFVPRAGSVRSITSIDQHDNSSTSHTTLSVPFKIQRTNSSSTLDSQDNALGPSGKGVLGVDYVEHYVLPTDTLQGVCIAYKCSATNLRRANHFTGQSLHSAPKKLLIPLSKQALRTGFIRVQDTDTKEYKLSFFQAECPDISPTEAKAYLELADWDLHDALKSLKEDREWQKEEASDDQLKAGQIGIKIDFKGGRPNLWLKGVGNGFKKKSPKKKEVPTESKVNEQEQEPEPELEEKPSPAKQKVVVHSKPPAIATKSVLPEDLYHVSLMVTNSLVPD